MSQTSSTSDVASSNTSYTRDLIQGYLERDTSISMDTSVDLSSANDDQISVLSNDFPMDTMDDDWSSAQSNNTRLSRFIVTFFPSDSNAVWLQPSQYFENGANLFQVWCGQFEICPTTGQLHAHIYAEFKVTHRKRFSQVTAAFRRFHNRVNIKSARKSTKEQRQGAVNYVVDPSKRAPDTECFILRGTGIEVNYDPDFKPIAKRKGKGEEDEAKRVWIESKPRFWTWDQIVHESEESKQLLYSCSWGEKYHKGRHAADKRREIRNVIILYGAGGTGKTTMAHAWGAKDDEMDDERYYRRNPDDGAFWGGGRTCYKGQRIVHYEEFTGQETLSRLKEVCDIGKQGPSVNVKNGGTILNHETVVFTSNVHPAGWFHKLWTNDPKQFHPFWRRVTKVLFFPSHTPEGVLAVPDENNPPYYIDQTEEWRQFQGSYDQVLAHAEVHWPLKAEEAPQAMLLVQPNNNGDTQFFQYCQTGVYPSIK